MVRQRKLEYGQF